MAAQKIKLYWLGALIFGVLFVFLFLMRLGVFVPFSRDLSPADMVLSDQALTEQDTWLAIFQNDRRIGYAHSILKNTGDGYQTRETLYMQIEMMGMARQVRMETVGALNRDLTVRSFDFSITSGAFAFSAHGEVNGRDMVVETRTAGKSETIRFSLPEKPYLTAGLLPAVLESGAAPGETLTFPVFDPSVMASVPVQVTVVEKGTIQSMGQAVAATRLTLDFKGTQQSMWVAEDGEVLEESGLMGLKLVKVRKDQALKPITERGGNFTDMAAISVKVSLPAPDSLRRLQVRITGPESVARLSGGRQQLSGDILTIEKESLQDLSVAAMDTKGYEKFLTATPFIQSRDKRIRRLAAEIVADTETPLEQARALVNWVYEKIDKRPVVSLPDALSTLDNREGDCNEHAVLLAALARAAGIPARVETGLVYLRGRFFYHAWNRFYLGRWITTDGALGQMPADVTHIRLATGATQEQLDLLPLIGRLQLEIISFQ